ncbi:hypothetical protein [Helicobacter mastomyrinus]|uniref:Uncharacterized protein n=2 Tax=Helicobacter TaxID=209 RepID=A0ABZ3F650_9HELI|nr:hypothetical protein [uncultured Helicobacter sp.]
MALNIETINDLRVIRSVGKLKSYDAFLTFKIELENLIPQFVTEDNILRIYFVGAYPLSSYMFGYLFKLRDVDKMQIEIVVDDLRLFMLFEEVDMVDEFKIKIMEE